MRKKYWSKFLAGLLATALAVTSIPVMEAQAASPLESLGLAAYDYTRMESIMQDGKELSYRNNSTGAEKVSFPMSFGEMVYLQFALPYNVHYDVKVLDESGNDLGYLYGKYYTEHVTETPEGGYQPQGKSLSQIKQELKQFVYEMPYTWANDFTGVGLTGDTLPYATLAEYYEFYGLEAPEDMAGAENALPETLPEDGETLPEEENPDAADPENGLTSENPDASAETPETEDPAASGEDAADETPEDGPEGSAPAEEGEGQDPAGDEAGAQDPAEEEGATQEPSGEEPGTVAPDTPDGETDQEPSEETPAAPGSEPAGEETAPAEDPSADVTEDATVETPEETGDAAAQEPQEETAGASETSGSAEPQSSDGGEEASPAEPAGEGTETASVKSTGLLGKILSAFTLTARAAEAQDPASDSEEPGQDPETGTGEGSESPTEEGGSNGTPSGDPEEENKQDETIVPETPEEEEPCTAGGDSTANG